MTLTLAQIRRLIAAGFLPADPEYPGELRDALAAVVAALPMSLSSNPAHELPAR